MLLVVSHHEGDAFDVSQFPGLCLRIAAGHDDAGVGIGAQGFADKLARLKVGKSGDRAGVDDVNVRESVKRDQGKVSGLQVPGQSRCVALIDLAAQGGQADFQYVFSIAHRFFFPSLSFGMRIIYGATCPLSRQTKNRFYIKNELNCCT